MTGYIAQQVGTSLHFDTYYMYIVDRPKDIGNIEKSGMYMFTQSNIRYIDKAGALKLIELIRLDSITGPDT